MILSSICWQSHGNREQRVKMLGIVVYMIGSRLRQNWNMKERRKEDRDRENRRARKASKRNKRSGGMVGCSSS